MNEFLTKIVGACRSKFGLAAAAILLAVLYVVLSGCSVTKNVTATDGSTVTDHRSLKLSAPESESTPTFPEQTMDGTVG